MSQEENQLTRDLVFDLLSSPRRRYLIYYLRTEGRTVKLTELADEVAAWEYESPVEDLDKQQRKRVYVSLYQTHVPKLAEAGLIEYDPDTGEITPTYRLRDVDSYLPNGDEPEVRWELIYLLLVGVSVVLLAVATLGAAPGEDVLIVPVGLVILLLFAVTAAVHYYVVRVANGVPENFTWLLRR
ncbi:DUF7344 domain-containing protein [Salinigranum marinum]|uniref:DUF7344 domain-containing protein n=1 Tax=Salinigranum marinum TaxID=1515595 RepID=UPI002989EEC6|nr:hypothetical protein [Salinigranum marinum]